MRACVQYGLNFESNSGANTLRAWFRQLAAVEASSILPGLPNQSTQLVPGSVHGGEIGPEDLNGQWLRLEPGEPAKNNHGP
jgi:hypothetical protein